MLWNAKASHAHNRHILTREIKVDFRTEIWYRAWYLRLYLKFLFYIEFESEVLLCQLLVLYSYYEISPRALFVKHCAFLKITNNRNPHKRGVPVGAGADYVTSIKLT